MHTAPPIKNLFLTLYLLNNTINENLLYDKYTEREQNTINENLLYDKYTQREQNASNENLVYDKYTQREQNTINENHLYDRYTQKEQNTINENLLYDKYTQREHLLDVDLKTQIIDGIQNAQVLPILQIPKSWYCLGYKGSGQDSGSVKKCQGPSWMYKQRFPYRGENASFTQKKNGAKKTIERKICLDLHEPLSSDSSVTTSEPELRENHGSNCFHNETIINQTNFFIILPESTKFSQRQNYSKSLSEIAKGGKGALNNLTNIMNSKTNKITTVKSTNEKEIQDIPSKVLDQIFKSTPNFILGEGTTPVILARNSTGNVDKCTTVTSPLEKTSTTIVLSSLLNLLIHESSTASRFKNISQTYAKAVGKKGSTTVKLQTQKIKIPRSPADTSGNTNNRTTQTEITQQSCSNTSTNSNNLTANLLEFLKKHNITQSTNFTVKISELKNKIDSSILKTTCVPENKASSSMNVIFLNNSRNHTEVEENKPEIEENSFLQLATIPPIVQDHKTKSSTETQIITTTLQTTVRKKTTTSIATATLTSTTITSTVTRMNTTKSTEKTTRTTVHTTSKRTNDTLKTESPSLKNVSQGKESNTGTVKVTTTEHDNCSEFDNRATHSTCLPYFEEYDEEEEKAPLKKEVDEESSEYSQHKTCTDNGSTTISNTCEIPVMHTTPKRTTCSRRQKSTTQMLPQKIFSPTMMNQGGKQKNGSVLVIKLISETSEKPFDLEHYVRMITFRKLNHKLRPNKKSIKTKLNPF